MTTVMAVQDLVIGYRGRPLLAPFSLTLQAGEFWGIVGPNGSGKTTLLKTFMGMLKPLRGVVTRANPLTAGYVPQRGGLDDIFPLTALDVVLMGRYPRRGLLRPVTRADRHLALSYLEHVGLTPVARRPFRTLSGGQKQRTLLARALAMEPDVLVLDEPTEGMDLAGQAALMELIVSLHQAAGLTVLLSTHNLTLVANSAHKLMILQADNAVCEVGETATLLTTERLRQIYGADIVVYSLDGATQVVVRGPARQHNARQRQGGQDRAPQG
jgi:ABC-type Mn2+/Zn2+ transport system ATPase subunit